MKKLFFLCLCALLTCVTACKDDNNDIDQPQTPPTTGDGQYLIMFYGVGGGDLDSGITLNMLQALEAGSSDKVKMTFQYRISKAAQETEKNSPDIMRFDADENAHLKGAFDATDMSQTELSKGLQCFLKLKYTKIGNADYVMASDTALVSFINWSKAQHPNATKTILIISDHGTGWELVNDGYKDFRNDIVTRAILLDDNTPDTYGDPQYLSLGDVKRALTKVGGVDVLYDDACLMSTWENLTGYSSVAKYFLGSLETAPEIGGNYHYFVNRLAENKVTDEGAETALKGYLDDVIDKWWEKSISENKEYGDLCLFNLQKIDEPLSQIKQTAQLLVEKWQTTDPIQGISANASLGDQWKNYIRSAITNCIAASNSMRLAIPVDQVPASLLQAMDAQGIQPIIDEDRGKVVYKANDVLSALKAVDMEQLDPNQEDMDAYVSLWDGLEKQTYNSYSFADFLRVIVTNLREAGLDDSNNPFVACQQQYIDALKPVCYIRCTYPLSATDVAKYGMIDYAYNCCSPGLFIYSFDKETYEQKTNFTHRLSESFPNVEDAYQIYKHSDFDQKTSWSSLLRLVDAIPSVILNPAREQLK